MIANKRVHEQGKKIKALKEEFKKLELKMRKSAGSPDKASVKKAQRMTLRELLSNRSGENTPNCNLTMKPGETPPNQVSF